jgi:hypothetical protein
VDALALVLGVDLDGVVNLGQVIFLELGVKGRADNLYDLADLLRGRGGHIATPDAGW